MYFFPPAATMSASVPLYKLKVEVTCVDHSRYWLIHILKKCSSSIYYMLLDLIYLLSICLLSVLCYMLLSICDILCFHIKICFPIFFSSYCTIFFIQSVFLHFSYDMFIRHRIRFLVDIRNFIT